jgi:enoyl-CoA hydratase/carnithine racemase
LLATSKQVLHDEIELRWPELKFDTIFNHTITMPQRQQLNQQLQQLEADIARSRQAIQAYKSLLFSYSQLSDLETGSRLIIDMTDRLVAERQQYETITAHHDELLRQLGSLTSQAD